ncbi:HlyD family efflux transporter periplasmic adaptor subunit [Vibrio ostreae]|uniref:HlyD family efflux transporter periplasmic adaptor subunit n=1 Tax=Vibrio ostreae TaxID=2841925 RepID=A0A975YMH6_9VIBR|nr:HlyD family efflux transporter periplasmic adaptor subunit [Vibrio ostreae]QXO16440.1 HlyD family efflux transporter periplasmic adaptor subunit [Vibrio ostreae]
MAKKLPQQTILHELDEQRYGRLHPAVRPGLWFSTFCVVVFVVWACWAEVDEVVRGDGRIVPVSRLQKIQSLEGGIIDRILVNEGTMVTAGQVLVRLDHTRFYAAFMEGQSQIRSLRASIARLESEVKGLNQIFFPAEVDINSPEVSTERSLFRARRDKKNQAVASLREEIALSQQQLTLIEPMVARKSVSEIEALRLRKDIASLRGRLVEVENAYIQDAYTELTAKKADLDALQQTQIQSKDQLKRTELISPVKGRVNNILVTSKGGVVQPGESIMEVLPIEDQLLVEARVKPKDVAFLAPGMKAQVKITAYDYTIYGDLVGTLEQISADTIEEDTAKGKEYYYQVLVRTDKNFLEHNGKSLPIRPGMIAQVDILGSRRSIMSYLLKPLLKSKLY